MVAWFARGGIFLFVVLVWASCPPFLPFAIAATISAAVVICFVALVISLEFVFAFLSRGDQVVRRAPSCWDYVRAAMGETICVTTLFAWRLPFREFKYGDQLDATGKRPVLLIHGFFCNRAIWNGWARDLTSAGRPFKAVSLPNPFAPLERQLAHVESAARDIRAATGAYPILIGHSMGGLLARAWQAFHTEVSVPIVLIGVPHQGSRLAFVAPFQSLLDMRSNSAWLGRLSKAESTRSPDPRRTLCWYSLTDNAIIPATSAVLPGSILHEVSGVGHSQLLMNRQIRRTILHSLEQFDGPPSRPL